MTCDDCNGTGTIEEVLDDDCDNVAEVECTSCDGTGEV